MQDGGLLCANARFAAFLRHTKDYFCIYGYMYLIWSFIQQSKLEN